VAQLRRLQALADNRFAPVAQLAGGPEEEGFVPGKFATVQLQPQLQQAPRVNHTGLPDPLESGIESLSGLSQDHVRVHDNSMQPAQLNTLAYAQGSDIHLAPGQEHHLPHEAWHVVQQAHGWVAPTAQMKSGTLLTNDARQEREVDGMGAKIMRPLPSSQVDNRHEAIAQRELAHDIDESQRLSPQQAPIRALFNSPRVMAQAKPLNGLFGAAQLRPDPANTSYLPPTPSHSRAASPPSADGEPRTWGVIQRLLVPFKVPENPNANQTSNANAAATIDMLTNLAYTNTWNRINAATVGATRIPLTQAHFPGIRNNMFTSMVEALGRNNDARKAMAVGYAIEDQVTYSGALPAGTQTQVHQGPGAILDFVVTTNAEKAVVDVTSSGEQGHVLDKSFNRGHFAHIYEATYPSINFNNLTGGVAPALGGDAAALAQDSRRRRANAMLSANLYQLRRWIELANGGIGRGVPGFYEAATRVAERTLALQLVDDVEPRIEVIDDAIAAMNALLPAEQRRRNLRQLIMSAQDMYLVDGNPWW
jgi:hypothetical protein